MDTFLAINDSINSFIWGPIMLFLLLGTGLYLSIRAGFIQFSHFGHMLKATFGSLFKGKGRDAEGNNISPFQAVSTALASTVGTGNIVGVATAISIGGPGAVFWMWISALIGMMTKYSEIVLAVKYRETNAKGEYVGGPMYYLKNGVGAKMPGLGKVLGVIFAIFAALACFGIGNMTQGNSIASSMESTFGISPIVSGIVVAIIVAVVIIGGIKSIARVTEMIVPFMAAFYIIFSLIILVIHAGELPTALVDVFKGAFNPESVLGGGAGVAVMTAVRMGFARGVFSNEAGLGSAPIAHAASSQKDPVKQGLWGIFEVFVDTILICTMTALVILTATDADGSFFWQGGEYAGAALTLKAFEVGLPGIIGSVGLTIGLLLFALSTMLGWSYYGEKAWEYLFRNNEAVRKVVVMIFRIVYVVAVPIGATGGLEFVWGVADTLNGCMAVPNLIGVLLLSGVVLAETKRYFTDLKKDKLQ